MPRAGLLSLAFLFVLGAPTRGLAHYPFPSSQEEKDAAVRIAGAVQARNQASVATLTELLGGEKPRIQTAALLGVMRLSTADLDFTKAAAAAGNLTDSKRAYVAAAAEAVGILLDKQTPVKQRRARLVKLTQSTEGRDRAMPLPRGQGKEGYQRRMACEALRAIGDASVLPALEALANDSFGDHDDSFDMKAVARVAFDVWWSIRSVELKEAEKLPVLVDVLRLGEPYWSRWCDAACDLLEKAGPKAVPLLIPVAKGDDRRAKLWAIRTLRQERGKEAVRTILDVCVKDLDSKDRLVRQSAMYSLADVADKTVLPTLTKVLAKNPDVQARERAAFALGKLNDEAALAALRAALKDADQIVRTQAAAQLARQGFRDGEAILLDSLGCREGPAGSIAAGAMPSIGNQPRLAERIAELLQEVPGEEKLAERPRILLAEMRNRMLRQLAIWDTEKLKLMAPILKPTLQKMSRSGWAKNVLKKMGD